MRLVCMVRGRRVVLVRVSVLVSRLVMSMGNPSGASAVGTPTRITSTLAVHALQELNSRQRRVAYMKFRQLEAQCTS